jgi:L-rhamnonate dehydratase
VRITEVETIVLRLPEVGEVCDGTQDAFVVRIMTDKGIAGIGEADSMPTVLKAVYDAPLSNSIGQGLRTLLIGQDPLQIEPLWRRMMESTLYLGICSEVRRWDRLARWTPRWICTASAART